MSHIQFNQLNKRDWLAVWVRRQTFSRVLRTISVAAVLHLGLIGCAATPSALAILPITGSSKSFQIHEYAIIEQSVDNPTHPGFQQRVKSAVSAQQNGWQFPGPLDPIQGSNEALAPFGYRLGANPTPPFSGYALYHGSQLIQRDISRIWPVSLKDPEMGSDFLLAFVTLDGDKLFASADGVHPWPGSVTDASTPPVYFGDEVAFAETAGSEVSVYAGSGVVYSGVLPVHGTAGAAAPVQASNLHSWGKDHWALELNGDVIVDGEDFNAAHGYESVFHWQVIDGQPFYFYTRGDITRLNYAGKDLPYSYDQVIHGAVGDSAVYNPGGSGQIIWYYALRDGVWYYVEARR